MVSMRCDAKDNAIPQNRPRLYGVARQTQSVRAIENPSQDEARAILADLLPGCHVLPLSLFLKIENRDGDSSPDSDDFHDQLPNQDMICKRKGKASDNCKLLHAAMYRTFGLSVGIRATSAEKRLTDRQFDALDFSRQLNCENPKDEHLEAEQATRLGQSMRRS